MGWLFLCLHLFLFHFPSFSFASSSSSSSSSSSFNFSCHPKESSALLHFESSLSIDTDCFYCDIHLKRVPWKNGTDCCSWLGVTCDTISGHVIGLNLKFAGLQGTILPNNSLFRLAHLQSLDLSYNNFSGAQLPSQFGGFLNLTYFHLVDTNFEGEIPSQMSHLSKLESLDLSRNGLVWKEATLKRLVQNATNLRELFLDRTDMSSINSNSLFSLLNHSSSLVSLSLQSTGFTGNLKNGILCLPSIQELDMSANKGLQAHLPELSCSAFLSFLHLSSCDFQGPFPSSLLTLPRLTFLDLSNNALSGQIPDVFGGITKLKELYLNGNNLVGKIPSSLFNLTQLSSLDCFHNKLEGSLPNKITGFQNLTYLGLGRNSLNGTIPSWCLSLPSLVEIDLSYNQFSGQINTAISSYSLEFLWLGRNNLQGNIPESISNLANLTECDLSSNNLSGLVDFQLFSNLQNLKYLFLSQNTQLSINFESNVSRNFSLLGLELSSVSLIELPKLSGKFPSSRHLDLSNNRLHGTVPNWLLEMDSLEFLNLSQNSFMSIDQFTRNNDQLTYLDLSFNSLAGDISLSICRLRSLELLNLAHNKLTGTIPQCLANLSLRVLDLQRNKLNGTLHSIFPEDSGLQTLNLNGNQLEGSFPKSVFNCTYLEVLNLGSNHIEDTFPYWLQVLPNLTVLVLRENKLHGPITNSKIKHPFPSLIIFDISCNNFSGPLPKFYLENFKAMMSVNQVQEGRGSQYMESVIVSARHYGFLYYDSMIMAVKGTNIAMVKIPILFVIIDFSKNKFEGEIPNVIGELRALIGLNLSHNKLTSHIPKSMGNLTSLESLDLSSNMLTGGIPAELTNLNFLEVLNLSHNHLVGQIPQGKQFNTFSNDSYEENLGLCGVPLSRKCGPGQHSPPPSSMFLSEEKFGFGWKPVAIGYGCGVVFGVGLGCCVLLMGKPRWLVSMVGGRPKRRVSRRRMRRTRSVNQLVQMS